MRRTLAIWALGFLICGCSVDAPSPWDGFYPVGDAGSFWRSVDSGWWSEQRPDTTLPSDAPADPCDTRDPRDTSRPNPEDAGATDGALPGTDTGTLHGPDGDAAVAPDSGVPDSEVPPDDHGIAWVSIPGGAFTMGDDDWSDSSPPHPVTVPGFEMTKTEVTVGQYRACMDGWGCTAPDQGRYCNFGVVGRDDHPVNCADWNQAVAFCSWAGGRLCSEAEWEYEAKGGGQNRDYPWGSEAPTCQRAVMYEGGYGCGEDRTWAVCSKSPTGNSIHGVCDMAGNVWEWIEDCWHTYDEAGRPDDGSAWEPNCSGSARVGRGGSCGDYTAGFRSAFRTGGSPGARRDYFGLRCCR